MTMVPASTSTDFTIGRVCVGGLATPARPTRRPFYPAPMLDAGRPCSLKKSIQEIRGT